MRIIQRYTVLTALVFIAYIFVAVPFVCESANATNIHSQTVVNSNETTITLESDDSEALLDIAREFLNHRNQHLIYGEQVVDQAPLQLSETLLTRHNQHNEILQTEVADGAEYGAIYTGFTTKVRLLNARKVNDKLVVCIEEFTSLYLPQAELGAPPSTDYVVERDFVFKMDEQSGWILEDVLYLDEGIAPPNEVVEDEDDDSPFRLEQSPWPTSDAPLDNSLLRTREIKSRSDL